MRVNVCCSVLLAVYLSSRAPHVVHSYSPPNQSLSREIAGQLLLIIQIAYIILSGTKDFAAGEYEAFV